MDEVRNEWNELIMDLRTVCIVEIESLQHGWVKRAYRKTQENQTNTSCLQVLTRKTASRYEEEAVSSIVLQSQGKCTLVIDQVGRGQESCNKDSEK